MSFEQDVERAAESLTWKFHWATRYVDIEDLRQEARISAWKTLTEHPGKVSYAIARGTTAVIDLIRKEGPLKRDGTFKPQVVSIDRSIDETATSPSRDSVKSRLSKEIERATSVEDPEMVEDNFEEMISCLSPRLQSIARMLFVEDYTQKEVADILGVTESRVCQLLQKIKYRVRRGYFNGNNPKAN